MKLQSYNEFLNEGETLVFDELGKEMESDEFLDEADDKKLTLAQETIQKKRDLEDKKSELIKKLKAAGEKDDARASKLLRLQIKKIELQISMLLIDEQIKEMSKK
jgi:hypothetical protein